MKKLTLFLCSLFCFSLISPAQQSLMEISFTAIDSAAFFQLDSILVRNKTQGGDTMLYYPDTVLLLINTVGLEENHLNVEFQLMQNFPNPVTDRSTFRIYVPESDEVDIIVTDILGRQAGIFQKKLNQGFHLFSLTPGGEQLYLLTATYQGQKQGVKVISQGPDNRRECVIEYMGSEAYSGLLKSREANGGFHYSYGNELLYIGYAGALQSGMLDTPEDSDTCVFQFATNIPCPGMPVVIYESGIYNTIQVFSQCWLKENMNVGERIEGGVGQTNNGVIEKYCFDNEEINCNSWGGLYEWNEMMQYTNEESSQGICPQGWHVPSDNEWKILEASVDSEYGIGDMEWEDTGFRGYDAGINLKSTEGWTAGGGGVDAFGFRAKAAGYGGGISFGFTGLGEWCTYWTSNADFLTSRAWDRFLVDYDSKVVRSTNPYDWTYSVRCLRD